MNEIHPIEFEIGFADSELLHYERRDNDFTVILKAWNEKEIVLRFSDTILVIDRGAWNFSEVCEFTGKNSLIKEALKVQYEHLPTEYSYRLFQFLNIDNNPSIEVVAASVAVTLA